MSNSRNLADLLDSTGDVKSDRLDNVPAADLVNDTTPVLGGNLDTSTFTVDGVDISARDGVLTSTTATADSALQNVSEDTTPQLGGALDVNGHSISFGDNEKARFGNSDDLEIYHDGTQSIISDVGSGNLNLEGESRIVLRSAGGSENYAQFFKDGAVELYYDNAKKLATTATGVDVTGSVTAGDGSTAAPSISFGADTNTGFYRVGSDKIGIVTAGSLNTTITTTGVGIGTSSPISPISVLGPTSNTLQATINGGSGGTSRGLHISTATTGTASNDIVILDCPVSTGTLAFQTNSTERMRIDSAGIVTMPNQPSFDAYTVSSSATFTNQVIEFNGISTHNTGSHYSTSTYRFTAPVAGKYLFTYNVQKSGSANTETQFQKNGAKVSDTHVHHTANGNHGSQSVVWYLNANDYVNVKILGGTISGDYSHFSGHLLG
jgi:hypothetical protein